MNAYSFELRVSGVAYDGFEDFADALFSPEVECTASFQGGIASVHFTWEASNFRDAAAHAIAHVRRADSKAHVVAIEADAGSNLDEAFAA